MLNPKIIKTTEELIDTFGASTVSYKGASSFGAGMFFAPYVPLMVKRHTDMSWKRTTIDLTYTAFDFHPKARFPVRHCLSLKNGQSWYEKTLKANYLMDAVEWFTKHGMERKREYHICFQSFQIYISDFQKLLLFKLEFGGYSDNSFRSLDFKR